MPQIQVLPKHLADMIAAGEVVERPASAVKELVENAIDAGARQITVEIRHGGSTYLRVTDDGSGIPEQEVPTAFLRHATSKLRQVQDLDHIGTLGFRGEALAAIAAVSRVQLLSKPAAQSMGYRYCIENGVATDFGAAGCPDGTTVVVRELFFSVPARYKFMKSDAAEAAAVHAVVERQALAHPEVAFRLLRDGKGVLHTSGDGDPFQTLCAVLGEDGPHMVHGTAASDVAQVSAYLSPPSRCKGSRTAQHFFVNGRWIKSKLLAAAVENAYRNQKMVGRFPAAVVWIKLRLDLVDVNSHPTKTEVRFVDERAVFGVVYRAALAALEGQADRPTLTTQPLAMQDLSPATQTPQPAPSAAAQDLSSAVQTSQSAPSAAQTGAAEGWSAERVPDDRLVFASPARTAYVPKESGSGAEVFVKRGQAGDACGPNRDWNGSSRSRSAPPAREVAPEEDEEVVAPPPAAEQTAMDVPAEVPWRVVGEVLRTYIVVEQGDSVIFIDKHAAHERMGFDALKSQGYRPMAQELLSPLVWRGTPDDRAVLLEQAALLQEFGFLLEDFGDALLVRAAPDFLEPAHIPAQLEELAARCRSGSADPDAQRDALMHSMACKAAMKGGQVNQAQELQAVAQAVMEGRVTHCPHGRPVATVLTRKQLEKQFGRSG